MYELLTIYVSEEAPWVKRNTTLLSILILNNEHLANHLHHHILHSDQFKPKSYLKLIKKNT